MGLILYCDGSVEPFNPGGVATYGVSIEEGRKEIDHMKGYLGEGIGITNNQTEYQAMLCAITWVIEQERTQEPIEFRADSQLMIRQLRGEWRIYAEHLRVLCEGIQESLKVFPFLTLTWIPRLQNRRADFLARKAYREHVTSHGTACVGWGTV